jgi:hypothetical protein
MEVGFGRGLIYQTRHFLGGGVFQYASTKFYSIENGRLILLEGATKRVCSICSLTPSREKRCLSKLDVLEFPDFFALKPYNLLEYK